MRFVCNNKDQYVRNLDTHSRNSRYGSDFHYPSSNLAIYHKSTYYISLKVLIVYHSVQRINFRILTNSNDYLRTFFTVIPFTHWMNLLTTIKKKTHYEDF